MQLSIADAVLFEPRLGERAILFEPRRNDVPNAVRGKMQRLRPTYEFSIPLAVIVHAFGRIDTQHAVEIEARILDAGVVKRIPLEQSWQRQRYEGDIHRVFLRWRRHGCAGCNAPDVSG